MLDTTAAIDISKAYAQRVQSAFAPASIWLFGSYAKGNARENSDIDIAVVLNDFNGDWLDASTALFRLRRGVDTKDSFIEPHLMLADDDFFKEVRATGIPIYERGEPACSASIPS